MKNSTSLSKCYTMYRQYTAISPNKMNQILIFKYTFEYLLIQHSYRYGFVARNLLTSHMVPDLIPLHGILGLVISTKAPEYIC